MVEGGERLDGEVAFGRYVGPYGVEGAWGEASNVDVYRGGAVLVHREAVGAHVDLAACVGEAVFVAVEDVDRVGVVWADAGEGDVVLAAADVVLGGDGSRLSGC